MVFMLLRLLLLLLPPLSPRLTSSRAAHLAHSNSSRPANAVHAAVQSM
jgi:hypothetical protein